MRKINTASIIILSISFIFGIAGPTTTFAATNPGLGAAATFGVLGGTYTNTTVTTINGDVGYTTGPATPPTVNGGTIYGSGVPTPTARTNIADALTNLNNQTCIFTFAAGAINLATDTTHGPMGVYTPGKYCTQGAGAASIGTAGITLNGAGIYIFQINGAFTSVDNSAVTLTNGASANDVFWTPTAATTLGANTTFKGTIIDNANAITVGANTVWVGRALSLGAGTVTTDTNTITVPATLHVIKTVVNNSGGVATASSFTLHVKLAGVDVSGSPVGGVASPGTSYSLLAGTYVVSEDANAGYLATFSGDCDGSGNVTLTAGQDKTCTITNDDIAPVPPVPATLHVIKTVVNNSGGVATASSFTLHVAGTNVSNPSFAGSASGVDVTLDAGSYSVTEPVVPTGYLESGSGDCSGTIAVGQTKTCTITNDDIAPQLIVNKIVINDNGGTKIISDFSLFTDGGSVTSGVASTTTIGAHTVSETPTPGYTATIGGNCAANGTITLALGDVKTCTITNDDIAPVIVSAPSGGGGGGNSYTAPVYTLVPPLIDIVKVPNPLALPDGPGTVKYTYTLHNIGTVPVSNVTMVGDTCSPIMLISGDTNGDAKLDVNETWTYTCSTTLTKTHTNIVTATGWANSISATDIANATVIVGVPVVPPLIHVTKIPSPLVLSAGGGTVTYTNKVTNPGTVALSNVSLADDKCGPVKYISGDTNGDSKLDTTETWIYICQTKITKTTVNTAAASGEANGLTARDFAIATVVVNAAVPKLPHAGLPPNENSTPWNIIIPTGIFAILTLFYCIRKKQTTS